MTAFTFGYTIWPSKWLHLHLDIEVDHSNDCIYIWIYKLTIQMTAFTFGYRSWPHILAIEHTCYCSVYRAYVHIWTYSPLITNVILVVEFLWHLHTLIVINSWLVLEKADVVTLAKYVAVSNSAPQQSEHEHSALHCMCNSDY